MRAGETTAVMMNGRGAGDDGSRVRLHDVIHIEVTPGGEAVVSFDKGSIECG